MNEDRLTTTESTRLLQRFVDQDLTAEERMRFVAELGRSESLRQEAMDLERLVLDAARLPRPAVPAGFVDEVMRQTAPPQPAPGRIARALWAPRRFQWNLAGALGAAATLMLVVAGTVGVGMSWRQAGSGPGTTAAAVASRPTVLVRLVVLEPGATTVEVAGDFNGWDPTRTPLDRVSQEAWAVTLPLEPGRYEYMFVVDGERWIVDPFAVEQIEDGFGSRNAVLDVRPPMGSPL